MAVVRSAGEASLWFRRTGGVSCSHQEDGLRSRGAATVSGMTKTELHELVDALPDRSLPAAAILLRRAQDPVVAKLDAAPYDDEVLTQEDLQAVQEARTKPGVAWSEVEAELKYGPGRTRTCDLPIMSRQL